MKRFRFARFSIRAILITAAVVCVFLTIWHRSARLQRASVETITAMGGIIEYESSMMPKWVVDAVGEHYFETARRVKISGFRWSRSERDNSLDFKVLCEAMQGMPLCDSLSLEMVGMKDEDLVTLKPLSSQLKTLSISEVDSAYVSHAGLANLKNWARLEDLTFNSASTTTADLSQLSTCERLQRFSLCGTWLEKEHFSDLGKCASLQLLSLSVCNFKGNELAELRPLKRLESVTLVNCMPEPYIGSWTISKSGEKTPLEPMTFHFRGGDPQFLPTPFDQPGFPMEDYRSWLKSLLPGIDVWELYMS